MSIRRSAALGTYPFRSRVRSDRCQEVVVDGLGAVDVEAGTVLVVDVVVDVVEVDVVEYVVVVPSTGTEVVVDDVVVSGAMNRPIT